MWKWNGKYPKVSIVVLNYNGRGLGYILDQCINSVINQNYQFQRLYRLLQLEIANFPELLRLKFKPSTGRSIIKIHEYIVKTYNDANECAYECSVLSSIALFKPITFRVPKVFKLLKIRGRSTLIMEYIAGRHLDKYILDFLLYGNSDTVKIFYQLGEAVRELHNMNLDGLRSSSLPSSCSELKDEIVELSKRLVTWRLINHKLLNTFFKFLEKVF